MEYHVKKRLNHRTKWTMLHSRLLVYQYLPVVQWQKAYPPMIVPMIAPFSQWLSQWYPNEVGYFILISSDMYIYILYIYIHAISITRTPKQNWVGFHRGWHLAGASSHRHSHLPGMGVPHGPPSLRNPHIAMVKIHVNGDCLVGKSSMVHVL